MQRIFYATQCTSYKGFLGGSENFRYKVNPEYKANRKDVPRPEWLQPVREYLVVNHGAKICDGIEADDALGIEQCKLFHSDPYDSAEGKWQKNLYGTVIVSVDKDLLMIPGNHYNFVKDEHSTVSKIDGLRWFYTQLILGDKADNIFGYDGKARTVVPKFLQPDIDAINSYQSELTMYEHVLGMYQTHGQHRGTMHMNARCLFIQQRENDEWNPPDQKETN